MLRHILTFIALVLSCIRLAQPEHSIVIHGGAGAMGPNKMDDQLQEAFRQKQEETMDLGIRLLKNRTYGMDVVVPVNVQEDFLLDNSGNEAVLQTRKGFIQMPRLRKARIT